MYCSLLLIQVVGELDFAVGQSEAIITISITDDTEPETLEYFYVQLFNSRGNLSRRYCLLLYLHRKY